MPKIQLESLEYIIVVTIWTEGKFLENGMWYYFQTRELGEIIMALQRLMWLDMWLVILSMSHLNSAWQPTNACMAWHHLTSPGFAHRSPRSPAAHTCILPINTNCSSPHVYIDVRSTGILLIGPVVLECSSLAASWTSHLDQHLQTILENSSFQQLFWLTVFHSTPTCALFS